LVTVNRRAPTDVIEYQQLIDGDTVELVIERDGRSMEIVVTKTLGEPLGLSIDSAVFDRVRTCDNHCSFCFIYQLPKGLRRSLYVKDDDFRLSFLYGNYTTLTRFTEFDLERVIDEGLSPLYVSIHTTDPSLRAALLRNPRGATSLRWLSALLDAGIEVHGQVVVCPGVNDGDALRRTLEDALSQYPSLASLCLVPVGVSDFSTEADMRPLTATEAADVVDLAEHFAELSRRATGRRVIAASDEMYIIARREPPTVSELDTLDEAENGVGLIAAFSDSFLSGTEMAKLGTGFFQSVDGAPAWGYRAPRSSAESPSDGHGPVVLLTGEYAAPILRGLISRVGLPDVRVVAVENRYFGGNIKVAGLLTGSDIARVVSAMPAETKFLLPDACLSDDRFLDGACLGDLNADLVVIPTQGSALRQWLESRRLSHVTA
jgi:NifB/MoaA-like Fe-S oxidoreductase